MSIFQKYKENPFEEEDLVIDTVADSEVEGVVEELYNNIEDTLDSSNFPTIKELDKMERYTIPQYSDIGASGSNYATTGGNEKEDNKVWKI